MDLTRVTASQLARSGIAVVNEDSSEGGDADPSSRFTGIDMAAFSINAVHRRNVMLVGSMWKLVNEVELGADSNIIFGVFAADRMYSHPLLKPELFAHIVTLASACCQAPTRASRRTCAVRLIPPRASVSAPPPAPPRLSRRSSASRCRARCPPTRSSSVCGARSAPTSRR
jgi:hypothetical protein